MWISESDLPAGSGRRVQRVQLVTCVPPTPLVHVRRLVSETTDYGVDARNDEFNQRECLAKNAKTSAWCDPMTVP